MALTAAFAADFDRFESSLKSAAFNLQVFDRATLKAMQGLKRETEGFSGQKVAVEAARMAEAVRRLGEDGRVSSGLIKLLPEELKRVSAALETAAAKAKLMGETLPPSLQKVRDEIAKMPQATTPAVGGITSLASAFKALGPLLGVTSIAGAAAAIARLGFSAIESAGQINDLSKQLGVSTDFIQDMQHVADQTGSSVETFTAATFKLGVNVAKGSKDAREAVADLGLAYQDLKGQLPEEQFRAVIKSLEDVENVQERNRLGVALFGKTWKEMSTSVAEGMTQIADGAPKMSQATIAALDAMGDAWTTMKEKAKVAAGEVIASVWETIQSIERASDSMTNWRKLNLWLQGGLSFDAYLGELKKVGDEMKVLDEAADRIIRESKLQVPAAATDAATDYVKALRDINAQLAALTPTQRAQIDAALKLGSVTEEMAEDLGLSAEALKVYQDHARESAAHTKKLADEAEKAAKAVEKFRDSVKQSIAVMAPFAASVQDIGESLHNLPSEPINETAKATEAARIATEAWADANGTRLAPSIKAVGAAIKDADLTKFGASIKNAIGDLPKVIMGALQGGGDIGKSIGGLFGANVFGADSALTKSMTGGLTKMLGKTMGGAIGSIIPGLGTLLGSSLGALTDKLFGKLFGGEGKQVNKLRDQFTAAAGGIDKLAQHAMAAGVSMQAFFAADTVKEYEAAIKDLDGAFKDLEANRALAGGIFDEIVKLGEEGIPDFLQPHINQLIELGLLTEEQADQLRDLADAGATNWKKVEDAAKKYGVRLESMGQPFNAQRINADAAGIINAFTAITNAGGDVGGVLFDMQEEISKVVQESLQFGTTIPANMKPWIEELSRAGLLVDKDGKKITDLSKIQFGDEIETEAQKTRKAFEGITKAIQDLINTLKGMPGSVTVPRPTLEGGGSGGGGGGGGGGEQASDRTFAPSSAPGGRVSAMVAATGGATSKTTFNVPIQVDGRTIADVVIDQMGNRLSVRGAR